MLVSLMPARSGSKHAVTFTKKELMAIVGVYSTGVAKALWRDYAMDFTRQLAIFSIFRHAHEQPLIALIKTPSNTASGFLFEVRMDKTCLSRTPMLDKALEDLRNAMAE